MIDSIQGTPGGSMKFRMEQRIRIKPGFQGAGPVRRIIGKVRYTDGFKRDGKERWAYNLSGFPLTHYWTEDALEEV